MEPLPGLGVSCCGCLSTVESKKSTPGLTCCLLGGDGLEPFIPALGRLKQVDLCESAASLTYRVNSGQPGLYRGTLFVATVPGHPHPLLASLDSGRVHGTHTYMQAKHSNINKILSESNK